MPQRTSRLGFRSARIVQGGLGGLGALALLTTVALAGLTPTQAWAGPRNANDPVLASLYLLRAALTFSAQGNGAAAQISADLKRAVSLNYYVVVPIEMRSDDLSAYMQQARSSSGAAAPAPITLTPPAASCGAPLHLEVLLSVPDGGQAALYWRKAGSGSEFVGAEMPTFSNVAEVDIPADQHGDANIEYFIYAFDASGNPAANLGLQDSPMTLEQDCGSGEPEVPVVVAEEPKPKATASAPASASPMESPRTRTDSSSLAERKSTARPSPAARSPVGSPVPATSRPFQPPSWCRHSTPSERRAPPPR
jgi:hypothetical protein